MSDLSLDRSNEIVRSEPRQDRLGASPAQGRGEGRLFLFSTVMPKRGRLVSQGHRQVLQLHTKLCQ